MALIHRIAGAYVVYVVLAAFFWGLSGGIGAMLLANGWGPFVVSFYRGVIGLLFVLVWLAWRPRGSGLGRVGLWLWSAVAGLGVAGNFVFYFVSIGEGSVAVAATLMYCAPVFVYLASFVSRIERPTFPKLVGIALVVLGIVLLTQVYDIDARNVSALAVAAGLTSGLSYAVFIFGFKYAARHGSPQAALTIAFTILTAVILAGGDGPQPVAVAASSDWPLFALLGLLGGGVSFVLYIVGLEQTAPAVAAIVAMIEPVTASLFGVVWLDERLAAVQIVGMGLILATVTALSVYSETR